MSLGSDNGEIEVATAAKHCIEFSYNIVSKNLSRKYILYKYEIIHEWCIRFELVSDAIISERHATRGVHKI